MRFLSPRILTPIVLCAALALWSVTGSAPRPHREAVRADAALVEADATATLTASVAGLGAFLDGLGWQAGVDAWNAEQEALRAAQAAEEAARAAARRSVAPTSTANRGPHSDAWWRGVAQCEQGGRDDPYFGFFSWMDGSAAGMTWDEQVAKSNALLATVSSESPAWAPSCVAMGYQYSPGG